MNIKKGLLCISLVAVLGGCASQPQLSNEQVVSQYQQVNKLEFAIKQLASKEAALLAPEGFRDAKKSLEIAMTAARNNKSRVANDAASKGLNSTDKIARDMSATREILAEVLTTRERAHKVGAKVLQREELADLDSDLKKLAGLIEDGDIEKAKQRRPKLLDKYLQLELTTLKLSTVDQAKAVILNAKRQDVEKYAPKTLAQAEEEIALSLSILDADRTQTDKADIHARKAKWLAEQSLVMTETIKDFERREYTLEDVVLLQQQQLKTVNEPLGSYMAFNEPTGNVLTSMQTAIKTLIKERDDVRALQQLTEKQSEEALQSAEDRLTALMNASRGEMETLRSQYEEQMAATEREREFAKQEELARQEKFETVQSMFDSTEANVFRQRQNVLISAHGFQFPSGQSDLQVNNYPMMNKIVEAINTFPDAHVELVGHTDAIGDDVTNQLLSETRAEKVAKFLVEVGGIAPEKVTFRGFGESRPVASNETLEGRAENRRVEIMIINE